MDAKLNTGNEKYTVVVADDEIALRQAIVNMVDWASIGFVVVGEAENGIEALDLVERLAPDLLLTDIKMPFVSGIELARQARELRPAMNIAFLSGYDDFAYAQEAISYNVISYLLKPISANKLTEALIEIKQKIDKRYHDFAGINRNQGASIAPDREQLLQNMMALLLDRAGGIGTTQGTTFAHEAEAMAAEYGFKRSASDTVSYAVLVIELFDGNTVSTKHEHINAVNSILRKYVKTATFYVQGKLVAVIAEYPNALRRYLSILASEIEQMVQRVLQNTVIIGVSGVFERLVDCRGAYYEAHRAAQYGYYHNVSLSFIDDIESDPGALFDGSEDITEALISMLKIDDIATIEHYLVPFFQLKNCEDAAGVTALRHSQVIAAVTGAVHVVMGQGGITKLFAYPQMKQVFAEVNCFPSEDRAELVLASLLGLCGYAKDLINDHQRRQSDALGDLALVAINEHYQNPDLSLATLAEMLHASPSYLSTIIKKTHGQTFTELLGETRMKTAKDMLLLSTIRIADIAEKAGFRDQHYFSYCFKKWYGVSPNKFRSMQNSNN